MDSRMGFQDFREKAAASTADIDDPPELAKIIGVRDHGILGIGDVAHPAIKTHLSFGVSAEIVEEAGSMYLREGWLAGLDAMQEIPIGVPVGLAEHSGGVAEHPGLKERGGGCQLEAAGAIFGEYSVAGQHPQESIQRLPMSPGRAGELVDCFRSIAKQIGDSQLGGNVNRAANQTIQTSDRSVAQWILIRRRFLVRA